MYAQNKTHECLVPVSVSLFLLCPGCMANVPCFGGLAGGGRVCFWAMAVNALGGMPGGCSRRCRTPLAGKTSQPNPQHMQHLLAANAAGNPRSNRRIRYTHPPGNSDDMRLTM
ncbi:hypothetical protein ACJQWK_03790 [Exserohilum turcicum]